MKFTYSPKFSAALAAIKDGKTQTAIVKAIAKVEAGNMGNVKKIVAAKGAFEIKVDIGPGYRAYFVGSELVALGDKKSQSKDCAALISIYG